MKFILFAILSAVLLISCMLDVPEASFGCADNTDCNKDRVCVDLICIYESELETYQYASESAEKILLSLIVNEPRYFAIVIPTLIDLDYGFDLSGEAEDRLSKLQKELEDDFYRLRSEIDFKGSRFVKFSPGKYAPIKEGQDKALVNLDSLIDSEIVAIKDGEEFTIPIKRIIRLRDRWLLFAFID